MARVTAGGIRVVPGPVLFEIVERWKGCADGGRALIMLQGVIWVGSPSFAHRCERLEALVEGLLLGLAGVVGAKGGPGINLRV